MEAIAIRLDGMETLAASSKASLGLIGSVQGDTKFSLALDNAMKATDGVQKPVEYTKPQEKPYEKPAEKQDSVSADDSKLKQMVSESEKTEETAAQSAKTENKAEEKVAVSEETEPEQVAALAEEDAEAVETEVTLALVEENPEVEDMAGEKVQVKGSKDNLVKNVIEPVLLHEESAETVAETAEDVPEADGLVKKSTKKTAKSNDAAAVFSTVQAEKSENNMIKSGTLSSLAYFLPY